MAALPSRSYVGLGGLWALLGAFGPLFLFLIVILFWGVLFYNCIHLKVSVTEVVSSTSYYYYYYYYLQSGHHLKTAPVRPPRTFNCSKATIVANPFNSM